MKELHGAARANVAASLERCFELLQAVERYPSWYPEVVKAVEVVERDGEGRPGKARVVLHMSYGPLVKDFRLLMAVHLERLRVVRLTRLPHEPPDPEQFEVTWRLRDGPGTRIELELNASLSVPRFLPVGGVGDGLANGFVAAAARALNG
jgi:hypothetical protein